MSLLTRFLNQKRKKRYKTRENQSVEQDALEQERLQDNRNNDDDNVENDKLKEIDENSSIDVNKSYFHIFLCGCSKNNIKKSKLTIKENRKSQITADGLTNKNEIKLVEMDKDEIKILINHDYEKPDSNFSIDKIDLKKTDEDICVNEVKRNSISISYPNNKKRKAIYLKPAATTTDDEENTSEIEMKNNKRDLKPSTGIRMYQHRGSHQNTQPNDGFPKFLTANNILTDRGCIVNIRTGSFNLGCTANSNATTVPILAVTNPLMATTNTNNNNNNNNNTRNNYVDDNKIKEENEGKKNFLIVPKLNICEVSDVDEHFMDEEDEYDDENCDNFDENLSEFNDFSQQRASVISNIGQNNLLSIYSDQQDQFRRCSHDPNIEKLHKNYINNVKLLDVPTPTTSIATLTAVTSSLSICKKSSSDSSFYNDNAKLLLTTLSRNSNNSKLNECKGDEGTDKFLQEARRDSLKLNSKSAEILSTDNNEKFNEILKVNEWLSDNQNHHLRHGCKSNASVSMSNMEESNKDSNSEFEKEQHLKKKKFSKKCNKVNGIVEGGEYDEEEDDDSNFNLAKSNKNGDNNNLSSPKLKSEMDFCNKKNDDAFNDNKTGSIQYKSRMNSPKRYENRNNRNTNKKDTNESNPTETPDIETNDSAVDIESYEY